MAIKDVILTAGMASYGLWNLLPMFSGDMPTQAEVDANNNKVDPVNILQKLLKMLL